MHGGLVRTGFGTGFCTPPAEGLEPDSPEFFSCEEVDDEVCRRVEADEEVRQVEAGLHERGHDARMALVGAEDDRKEKVNVSSKAFVKDLCGVKCATVC